MLTLPTLSGIMLERRYMNDTGYNDFKKPPTRPWEPGENPWKRDHLRLQYKRQGFRPRWVSERNIDKNLDLGWTFADRRHYRGLTDKPIQDGAQLDSRIKKRELILMEIPEELAKKREEYYSAKADKAEHSIKQRHEKDVSEVGSVTYNPIS